MPDKMVGFSKYVFLMCLLCRNAVYSDVLASFCAY